MTDQRRWTETRRVQANESTESTRPKAERNRSALAYGLCTRWKPKPMLDTKSTREYREYREYCEYCEYREYA